MARVKPRQAARRRSSSSGGEDDNAELTRTSPAASEEEQEQEQQDPDDDDYVPQQQRRHDKGLASSRYQYYPASGSEAEQEQPGAFNPAPRSRARKRKPAPAAGAAAAADEEEQAAAQPAKRTRHASSSRGYRELDDEEFEYVFASSEPEEEHAEHEHHHGVDDNDSHCAVCGSDGDADKLLCCENCPAVYHLYCLDPPLVRVPRGTWLCPPCEAADKLLDDARGVDKILAVREVVAADESGAGGVRPAMAAAGDSKPQPQKEFFIKWKEQSYLHCSWVAEDIVNRATAVRIVGQANPITQRLRKFWRDQAAAAESGELAEAEETGELVHGINPAWTQVDKVLAERLLRGDGCEGGSGLQYLVSWQELPLEHASWEDAEVLADFSAEIAAFHAAQQSIAAEAAQRKRADAAARAARVADGAAAGGMDIDGAGGSEHAVTAAAAATGAAAAPGERGAGTRKFEATPDFVAGGPLHPYQLEGLNWLYHKARSGDNVILADEMGLGKTIQTIAFLGSLWKDYEKLPHLVVVPLTTLLNWERELALWAPYLRVISLKGSAAARSLVLEHCMYAPSEAGGGRGRAALQDRVKFHVMLTTYEMVSKHLADIKRLHWAALVVDEAHRLKNATSRLFQDLVRVTARHRLLLTGTPLQNSLEELFFLMNFLEPTKFPSVEVFKETYATLDDKDKVSELHRQLAPHLLRRLKKDVLKQLPPKMEQIVRVEMSDEQRQLYKAILARNYEALVDKSKSAVRLRNVMMELRKAVNHPCLLSFDLQSAAYKAAVARRMAAAAAAAAAAAEAAEAATAASNGNAGPPPPPVSEPTEQLVAASGKLALLDKMMARLAAGGHRVLIYSQFTRTLDVLEDWVAGRGWGYERIDGDVAGLERQRRVDSFNNNPGRKFVFLLSTRAGGLGINLATADTVIIYDSDWNPHNDLQALARAHRMGQKRGVMVFRLVTRSTVEERMLQRAKSKLVLEHLVVAKAAKTDKLAQAELDDILRYGAKELFADEEDEEAAAAAAGGKDDEGPPLVEAGKQPEAAAEGGGENAAAGADKAAAGDAAGGQEAAAGRKQHMKIVWDDAAVERLLDRKQVEGAAAAAAAEDGDASDDEFTKAFKVANFDMVVEAEPEPEPEPEAPLPGDDEVVYDPAATELHKSQQQFWAAILGDRGSEQRPTAHSAAAAAAAALEAGAGLGQRRARNAARYIFFDSESGSDSGAEAGEGEGDGEGAPGDKGRRRKRPADDDVLYEAAEEQGSDSEEIDDDADMDGLIFKHAPGTADTHHAIPLQHQPQHQTGATAAGKPAGTGAAPGSAAGLVVKAEPGEHKPAAVPPAQQQQQQQQQQQPPPPEPEPLPPRVEGSGAALRICGLTSSERHAFMSLMMHFGPPFIHKDPDVGWGPYTQHIVGKSRKQLASYMLVLLEHLQDCANSPLSSHGSTDYLPHSLFFVSARGQVAPVKIWERLTSLHLLAIKMWQHGNKPAESFYCGGAPTNGGKGRPPPGLYKHLTGRPGGWGPAQDFALVRGIFMAGYACWAKILALPSLKLKDPLRTELGMPLGYDSAAAAAAAAAPPVPPPNAGVIETQASAHSRMVSLYRKKELDWLERRAKGIVYALRAEFAPRTAAPVQQPQQRQQRPQAAGAAQANPNAQAAEQAMLQQQQQLQRQLPPPAGPVTSPSPTWRGDVVALYSSMKRQLATIKQEASCAMKGERADDRRAMQNAAEQFRTSVKRLQQQSQQLEIVLRTLLPAQQRQQQQQPMQQQQRQQPKVAPQPQQLQQQQQQPYRPLIQQQRLQQPPPHPQVLVVQPMQQLLPQQQQQQRLMEQQAMLARQQQAQLQQQQALRQQQQQQQQQQQSLPQQRVPGPLVVSSGPLAAVRMVPSPPAPIQAGGQVQMMQPGQPPAQAMHPQQQPARPPAPAPPPHPTPGGPEVIELLD